MVEDKLKQLGIQVPEITKPLGSYCPGVLTGNLLFISGQLPLQNGVLKYSGKVGDTVTTEQGYEAAKLAAINSLAIIRSEIGNLDLVKRIVKVTGYVSSAKDYTEQAKVVNGASDLYFEVFGEIGIHSRAAVGVYELPLGSPVEVEIIIEV